MKAVFGAIDVAIKVRGPRQFSAYSPLTRLPL